MLCTCVWKVRQLPHSKIVNPSGHSEHWYHSVCHQRRDLENCGTPSSGCPRNPSGTPHINMSPAEKWSFNSTLLPQRLFRVKRDDNSYICYLTLILLMWRICWAPNNASKWQMGFNSVFKGLKMQNCSQHVSRDLMALVKELKLWVTHTILTLFLSYLLFKGGGVGYLKL